MNTSFGNLGDSLHGLCADMGVFSYFIDFAKTCAYFLQRYGCLLLENGSNAKFFGC